MKLQLSLTLTIVDPRHYPSCPATLACQTHHQLLVVLADLIAKDLSNKPQEWIQNSGTPLLFPSKLVSKTG